MIVPTKDLEMEKKSSNEDGVILTTLNTRRESSLLPQTQTPTTLPESAQATLE